MTNFNHKVLITTVPFGGVDPRSRQLLDTHSIDYTINPLDRKLTEEELAEMISPYTIIIAGTEPITARVMDRAPGLRLISRVGVGLDSVDLYAARDRGIIVSYTPEAPAPAVSELAVGLMLSLLRFIPQTDRGMRQKIWKRSMGRRLGTCTVGIIGVGRIGKGVIRHLAGFSPRILGNDIEPDDRFFQEYNVEHASKEQIYREADILSLHVPLTPETDGLIGARELVQMKPDALLINTARGPHVQEAALIEALKSGAIGGAAIDVFEKEPYDGELTAFDNCLLTCHIGSCSVDCRARMEIEATEEVIRFIHSEPLQSIVPETEYLAHGKKE